ncbi:hypothetical protein CCFV1_ORF0043 [Cotesia congregata filamentous virus 1]|uniref:Uncharacterized protein n=1 Tax=Cotesia congregata filamentous virus 1 TaxID=3064291 RepID=A0ABC8QKM7_9VIRU|nr:hypothetical protein CCFV1_ORF0043 [Cotesia congregata filamentous virus 1]
MLQRRQENSIFIPFLMLNRSIRTSVNKFFVLGLAKKLLAFLGVPNVKTCIQSAYFKQKHGLVIKFERNVSANQILESLRLKNKNVFRVSQLGLLSKKIKDCRGQEDLYDPITIEPYYTAVYRRLMKRGQAFIAKHYDFNHYLFYSDGLLFIRKRYETGVVQFTKLVNV